MRVDQPIQVKWIQKHRGQSVPYIQQVLDEANNAMDYAARVPRYQLLQVSGYNNFPPFVLEIRHSTSSIGLEECFPNFIFLQNDFLNYESQLLQLSNLQAQSIFFLGQLLLQVFSTDIMILALLLQKTILKYFCQ